MSLITERVRKAIQRCGGRDFASIRDQAHNRQPAQLASKKELAERHRFLLQTEENPRAADAAFERIIHGNELQDVNYLERGTNAARSIGRIVIREPNGRLVGYGTGFLIGPGVLLTNNHVLLSASSAQRSEVEFEYQRDYDGRQLPGVKFSLEPEKLFFTHEALDFSVVAVALQAVNAERGLGEFGFLPLIGGTGKAVEGEWLTIVQHPGGELKQVCVRENRLLDKGPDVLWYSTDTLGGSSGAPVFNNDWLVVALHHSGVPEIKDGRWQTIDGHDYDERIHREEDIKWVANEGIRASRIVATLAAELPNHPLVQPLLNTSPAEILVPVPSIIPPETAMNPNIPASITPSLAGQKFLVSFDAAGRPSIQPLSSGPAAESLVLEKTVKKAKAKSSTKGVPFRFDSDYSNRKGFDTRFLGKAAKTEVHLPILRPALEAKAVRMLPPDDTTDYVLKYTNMSLVMHKKRKFAIYSAANLDCARRYAKLKSKRVWKYDPRIPLEVQQGDEIYAGNQFDRGHLTRQEDMEYGDSIPEALQSTADTCHWTNSVLQHQWFNRTEDWWQGMEQHILERSVTSDSKGFRAQIFTGPIFRNGDPEFDELPTVKVPMKFWKICVAMDSSSRLFAVAYLLDQSPVIQQYGVAEAAGEAPFEPYKLFQLPIEELQDMIHMDFTYGANGDSLSDCDPLRDGTPPELDADQDGDDDRLESAGLLVTKTPENWVNLLRRAPYLG